MTPSTLQDQLLVEVQAFQERIIPLFETRDKLIVAQSSTTLLTSRVNDLEGEVEGLKRRLKDEHRATSDVVAVAEEVASALALAREEKAACLVQWEVDKQAREEHEAEARKLRGWLEEHKKDVSSLYSIDIFTYTRLSCRRV
jgi:hypothetical protein